MALVVPFAALAAGTVWGGFARTALPAAALVSMAIDPGARGLVAALGHALFWGIATSLGSVLLYMALTFAGALVGLVPNTPETPLGYLLILVLTVVSITPFLAVPLTGSACCGCWCLDGSTALVTFVDTEPPKRLYLATVTVVLPCLCW